MHNEESKNFPYLPGEKRNSFSFVMIGSGFFFCTLYNKCTPTDVMLYYQSYLLYSLDIGLAFFLMASQILQYGYNRIHLPLFPVLDIRVVVFCFLTVIHNNQGTTPEVPMWQHLYHYQLHYYHHTVVTSSHLDQCNGSTSRRCSCPYHTNETQGHSER